MRKTNSTLDSFRANKKLNAKFSNGRFIIMNDKSYKEHKFHKILP